MKKLILLLITLISVSTSMAQFRFGVKAGGNISSFSMTFNSVDTEIYEPKTGLHAGLMGEIMFKDYLGLQMELIYFKSGASINPKKYAQGMELPENLSLTGYVNMSSFQLPLYVKTKINLTPNYNIYIMGGGFASYAPTASQNITYSDGTETLKLKWSLYDYKIRILDQEESNVYMQHRWNFGLAAEAGIDFKKQITVGIGFRNVLNNMAAFGYIVQGRDLMPTTKMWTLTLSIGHYF